MTKAIGILARAFLTAVFVAQGGRAAAQGADEDSASRMDALVELLRGIEEGPPGPPQVFDGVDTRSPDVARLVRAIRETRVSLSVEKLDLLTTIDILRQVGGVNLVVSPKAREAIRAEKPAVSISLRAVTLENALNLLALHLGDFRFTVRYGAVHLIRNEERTQVRVTRLYPVQDLVRPLRDFAAPTLALTNGIEKKN